MTPERQRLLEAREQNVPWRKWGPYLTERQWGTVREDYSQTGNAWDYFSHDQARSRAYRWGEDGIGGICDDRQRLCFAIALWNGVDPILKERLFGLTNSEGNHGEDVKEYYYYLDSTPTHSYMKFLYKYPQLGYPYSDLVDTNRSRGRSELEYELIDTGAFVENRYFDVFVEYAKASPEDVLIQITAHNRGPEQATLYLLPTLWFRNTWSWRGSEPGARPALARIKGPEGATAVIATHPKFGERRLICEGTVPLLFTENETNDERIFGRPNAQPYVKDAFHNYLIAGRTDAVNPAENGTKSAALYQLSIPAGGSQAIRLRLCAPDQGDPAKPPAGSRARIAEFDQVLGLRRKEADEFYETVIPAGSTEDQARVMRQAFAGMLWGKQFYYYDVNQWLDEKGADPFNPLRLPQRNDHWHHMYNADVISMPDKWEYPWYAAWDLAFQVLAIAPVDIDFARDQLELMLRDRYLHPNGQLPAYEWNFGDVNPPVHGWATFFLHSLSAPLTSDADIPWLESCFNKLVMNFTWWVNRKDRDGRNVFEGGFLGLDNVGVFDRSAPLPTGGYLEQADGTAWMALFCQNMLQMALELSRHNRNYEEMVIKFVQHFLWIASAMSHVGDTHQGMWDEEDGFFYDVLRTPDGHATRLKVRSMVGLLPLCAATVYRPEIVERMPEVHERLTRFINARPELVENINRPGLQGIGGRRLLAVLNDDRLRRVLAIMLDEREFLSPYGIRSLSRFHEEHPYVFHVGDQQFRVGYLPAESDSGMFGGNSNWRGPIWMPVNVLIIRALINYHSFYGDDFKVECPTGSGNMLNLFDVAKEIGARLSQIFLRDKNGERPVFGGIETFQTDPHWKDHLQFYEYFHGDNGAGLGANHQTGWTGLVAFLMWVFGNVSGEDVLELDRAGVMQKLSELASGAEES